MSWSYVWPFWILICVFGVFAVFETIAIKTGRKTLSMWTWELFQKFPLVAVVFGMIFGGLAVHFFWHWCPAGSVSAG